MLPVRNDIFFLADSAAGGEVKGTCADDEPNTPDCVNRKKIIVKIKVNQLGLNTFIPYMFCGL